MTHRTIQKVITGKPTRDGAGVSLTRVIGNHDVKEFDPFLMLDSFDSTHSNDYISGFPWHPHRGIETVTYLISGKITHRDSLGNEGTITDGSSQWMTAGSGIIHEEMPQASQRMFGIQLWINLPKVSKMCPPKYNDILANEIVTVTEKGATVKIISGNFKESKGKFHAEYVDALFLDVSINPANSWSIEIEKSKTLFIFILDGECSFSTNPDSVFKEKQAVLFEKDGDLLEIKSTEKGTRLLLLSAAPLKEPIAWGGPIVMNTEKELMFAFEEIEKGTFLKHGNS